MGESVDPKKLLLPYLQRADELQKHEPLVAYYCRLFAMERGLKVPNKERGKTVNGLLVSLMNQLEKDKKTVKLGADDNMYLEGFATRVFTKADKQDRAGRADLSTAKTFYAASLFFEVLHQFGEIPPDIEQRQKYAVWKAADIRKALSEGRKPVAGPPGGDEDFSEIDGVTWDSEESTQKLDSPPKVSSSSPERSQPEEPRPGPGNQPPTSDALPRMNSFDSLPQAPTSAPAPQGRHHTRQVSSDDIDLPAAPTQPVYPGMQHSYSAGPPSPYAPTHRTSSTGQAPGAPPPVIHDWSGGDSQENDEQSYPGVFTYPAPSHDDYGTNPSSYSSMPPASAHQSTYGHPPDQSYDYSAYPSTPASGYQGGNNAYPSASPQSYGTGYAEVQHHQRTTSAPPVVPQASGFSNGTYPSDVNYHPPPDKVAEAHKAARFAVSSLAFDDVQTALEYLRKSLELLTIPSRAT